MAQGRSEESGRGDGSGGGDRGEEAAAPGPRAHAPAETGEHPGVPAASVMAAAEHRAQRTPFPGTGRLNYFTLGFTGALGVLTAWLLVQALIGAQGLFVNILVALFLAVGLNPVIESLHRRGLPRWAAILTVCVALIAFVTGFVWTLVPPLTQQFGEFIANAPDYVRRLGDNRFLGDLERRFHVLEQAQQFVSSADFGQRVFGGVFGFGQAVLNSLIATFTVLVLTLFFMASLPGITEVAYRLVPRSRRARVRELGDEIIARVGGYIGGQLLVALIGGVVALVFLTAIGSGYALTLALVVAVTALIPLIGTTIGALAATLAVGLGDLRLGAVTLVFFLVYQQIESYVIAPRVMRRSVDVAPTVTITAALLGGALLGLVGALIAIPVAAAVTLVLKQVVFPRLDER
ncbi:AI-2E family transporter [Nocardiopsis mangrovi]|uniref:AI-2E family transporter n=1 Tax=Nocardiopsis mangrovi TaxID=1179818 RepID=A0ABV9E584_9ACTN